VVSFTRTVSPRASEKRRLDWTLGSHALRVFFFEKGTLFPYCFVFPWKRPSCDRLKGWLSAAAKDDKEGNMGGGYLVRDRCRKAAKPGRLARPKGERSHGTRRGTEAQKRQVRTEDLPTLGHRFTRFLHNAPGIVPRLFTFVEL